MKMIVMNQQMLKDYENEEREMSGEKNIDFFFALECQTNVSK